MRSISRYAVLTAFLFVSFSVSANLYYFTSASAARSAVGGCTAYITESNGYYCSPGLIGGTNNTGGQTNIGYYILKTSAGSQLHIFYFGYVGSIPATYECPPDSVYNSGTGKCSGALNPLYVCPVDTGANYQYIAGSGCVVDPDNDGLFGSDDNCPSVYNPDQADIDYDGIGDVCDNCLPGGSNNHIENPADSISTSIPGTYCSVGLCQMQKTAQNCSDGVCSVDYSSNGDACTDVDEPSDWLPFFLNDPASYGYDFAGDNANFTLHNGLSSLMTKGGYKFKIANCTRSATDGNGIGWYDWGDSLHGQKSCTGLTMGVCKTPQELDDDIQSYIRSNPYQSIEFPSTEGFKQYMKLTSNNIVRGSDSYFLGYTNDPDLGVDEGNGSYTATVQVNNYDIKRWYDDSGYWVSENVGNALQKPMVLYLDGCTSGSGGSGGLDEMAGHFNSDYGDSTNLFGLSDQGIDQIYDSIISDHDGQADNLTNTDLSTETPDFFQPLLDLFSPEVVDEGSPNVPQTCSSLVIDKFGVEINILDQFCTMWDNYGRPIFSFLIYMYTLIGIANIWLVSGSSR